MCHTQWQQAEHAFYQAGSSACYVVCFGVLRQPCAVGFDLIALDTVAEQVLSVSIEKSGFTATSDSAFLPLQQPQQQKC